MPHHDEFGWRVNVWVAGKRKTKRFPIGTPKKIVEEYERKLKLSQIDPAFAEKKRLEPTFYEFANKWLTESCSLEHSFSYSQKCKQVLKQHLAPKLGKMKVGEITSQDLMQIQRTLRENGYAVQSINNILATASSIFKEALVLGLITHNPCAGIRRFKKGQRPEMEVWTLEERDRFLSHLYETNFSYFQICAVALFSGLRPSEVRGLLRDAIDFERCQIRVFRQWCTKQNMLVNYTKTREARNVPVPRVVLDALADKRNLSGDAQLFPFICNGFGHKELKPLMTAAGVKQIRMHDFRHTFASQMLLQGASLFEVKELLGHRKLESTMIYLHFIPDRNHGATERLVGKTSWLPKYDNVIAINQ